MVIITGGLPIRPPVIISSNIKIIMSKKLKVLMVSEASFLSSGFGTYTKEILSRLHQTGKYEIAEFACYGKVNDPKDIEIDWKYYANAVEGNDPRSQEYNSSMENQFGKWRFERVLIDFKPDIVIDVRDYWMSAYQQFSPLRPYFHWILMPTVDSAPQQEEWIDTFVHTDAIFTYSDFGRDTLLRQSNNSIKYIDTTSPGVSLQNFQYLPKESRQQLRQFFGIDPEAFVIGSVMRNQKRKLIPELFVALKEFIKYLKETNHPKADKTFLYLHTSYPDAGWDLPLFLKEYEIGNKVLFTYSCKNCKFYKPSLYQHPLALCPRCGQMSMSMPNVSNGISQQELNTIYNVMDIYTQYAICEGFGMPQVEAGAAGVPIASVNYSAMEDIVQYLKAYPIKVNQFFRELETKAIRVYPDNESLLEILKNFIELPEFLQEQKRHETRKLTEARYNWDDIAKKWEKYLDSVKLSNLQGKWDQILPQIAEINPQELDQFKDLAPSEQIMSIVSRKMGNHPLMTSTMLLNMIKDSVYGFTINGIQTQPYNLEHVINTVNNLIKNHNIAMTALANEDKISKEDFISYAAMKENLK
jgi:glycosyltransferase involved in cell wall biosynthesis